MLYVELLYVGLAQASQCKPFPLEGRVSLIYVLNSCRAVVSTEACLMDTTQAEIITKTKNDCLYLYLI